MNRFWSKVDAAPSDCCWEWLASKFSNRYGQFKYKRKMWKAHRFAYQLSKGTIPDGMSVRHTCDNPACCNPAHLVIGTHQDNMNDRSQRNRQAKGESNGFCKFTNDQVRQVFLAKGTQREIAKQFNISNQQVSNIKRRQYRREATDGL